MTQEYDGFKPNYVPPEGVTSLEVVADFDKEGTAEPNSRDSKVAFSLFNVLGQLGYIDESLFLINKLVSDFPNSSKFLFARANIYRVKGQLSNSIAGFKNAIQLLLLDIREQPEAVEFNKILPNMVVEHGAIAILDLKRFLDENDIPFFLSDGTLLGIHRDGELLSHDHDIDIGLSWDIPRQELVNLISQSENFAISEDQLLSGKFDWNIPVSHKTNGVSIDFFFFKPEGEFLDCGLDHLPNPMVWRFSAFKTKLIQYRGNDYAVPENPEQYLIEAYGPNWRIPDPFFDSLVSGHNLTPESKYISLAYAYLRLYSQINRANWKRAFSYCQQIFAYEKEPWLVELAGWLDVKMNEE
jgi:tetratricopeptide (TPR) repeat protein